LPFFTWYSPRSAAPGTEVPDVPFGSALSGGRRGCWAVPEPDRMKQPLRFPFGSPLQASPRTSCFSGSAYGMSPGSPRCQMLVSCFLPPRPFLNCSANPLGLVGLHWALRSHSACCFTRCRCAQGTVASQRPRDRSSYVTGVASSDCSSCLLLQINRGSRNPPFLCGVGKQNLMVTIS